MKTLGLIREEKVPADNRVALTPAQCKWLLKHYPDLKIIVQSSPDRCFTDREYAMAGISISQEMERADVLLGIKEVPIKKLIPEKTYLFFSHTKKLQPHNQQLFQNILQQKITLIDYECLEHEDGKRIIGFGFFAGIVGAHNGIMCYGERTGAYHLERVYKQRSFRELIHSYFGLTLPNIKIAVTGSGRVAHGAIEIMNLMGIHEVEADQYLSKTFQYPVFVQLKGADLYVHKEKGTYSRDEFHLHPEKYGSTFKPYIAHTDILMNGVYWEAGIPPLFETDDVKEASFRIQTIADISDDKQGSIPINYGDQTIQDPVYGVDKQTLLQTDPFLPGSVDIMAIGNLPNELPRDASRYFGEQLIKHVFPTLLGKIEDDGTLERATIVSKGCITKPYAYMKDYGGTNHLC